MANSSFRPLFICGFPRSGTTLFSRLLDNHPALVCFPEETLFRKWCNDKFENTNQFIQHLLTTTMIRNLNMTYNPSKADMLGSGLKVYQDFPIEAFSDNLNGRLQKGKLTPKESFEALMLAFKACVYPTRTPNYFVEKNPSNEFKLRKYIEWWPNLSSIYVVRNPFDAIFSHIQKNYTITNKVDNDLFFEELDNWRKSLKCYLAFAQVHPNNCLLIKYENLVKQRKDVMSTVAEHLNISNNDVLLSPTHMGHEWNGVSSTGAIIKNNSDLRINRWEQYLTEEQKVFAQLTVGHILTLLGYPVVSKEKVGRKRLLKLMVSTNSKKFRSTYFQKFIQYTFLKKTTF